MPFAELSVSCQLQRAVEEFRKEKPIGRLVKGRLTQPIEEKEVGAAHLIQEKVTRKKNTIEAQISDGGEAVTFDYRRQVELRYVYRLSPFKRAVFFHPSRYSRIEPGAHCESFRRHESKISKSEFLIVYFFKNLY